VIDVTHRNTCHLGGGDRVGKFGSKFVEADRRLLDERLVDPVRLDDASENGSSQREIGTWLERDVVVGDLGGLAVNGVDHDEFGVVLVGRLADPAKHDRVGGRRIRAPDDVRLGLGDVVVGWRRRVTAERVVVGGDS